MMHSGFPFATVTLSPALDVMLTVHKFPEPGDVLKGFGEVETPGGKGLNSARWLAMRGHRVVASGIIGAEKTEPFEVMMAEYGIEDAFIRVPGPSRRNVMYTSPGGMFKLNRPAFPNLKSSEWSLDRVLAPCQAAATVCILAGSLPPSVPVSIYAEMIEKLKAVGVSPVLDASGSAMEFGLDAGPAVIKPNRLECAELIGREPKSADEFRRACLHLLEKSECVIISDGPDGCWFADRRLGGRVLHGSAPVVNVVDTTAAGDALLAEFCHRYFPQRLMNDETIRQACAAGSAATTMPGAGSPSLDLVEKLASQVVVTSFV